MAEAGGGDTDTSAEGKLLATAETEPAEMKAETETASAKTEAETGVSACGGRVDEMRAEMRAETEATPAETEAERVESPCGGRVDVKKEKEEETEEKEEKEEEKEEKEEEKEEKEEEKGEKEEEKEEKEEEKEEKEEEKGEKEEKEEEKGEKEEEEEKEEEKGEKEEKEAEKEEEEEKATLHGEPNTFLLRLWEQIKEGNSFSDVTLEFKGHQTLPCHSVVLVSLSPFFEAALTTDTTEKSSRVIHLPTTTLATFNLALAFTLGREVKVGVGRRLRQLLELGEMLQLWTMTRACGQALAQRLTLQTCLETLKLVHKHRLEEMGIHCVV